MKITPTYTSGYSEQSTRIMFYVRKMQSQESSRICDRDIDYKLLTVDISNMPRSLSEWYIFFYNRGVVCSKLPAVSP
jgi:hypothetical protein